MKTTFEIEPTETYETHRNERLRQMQEVKRARRMQLVDDVSFLWESRETVRHQVQEMARMEGEDDEAMESIRKEYEEILPNARRMTATVFVEVKEQGKIKSRLGYYAGLENAFTLDTHDMHVMGRVVGDHGTEEATTAVTYLAFDLPEDFPFGEAQLVVDHPRLHIRTPLPEAVVEEPY